MTAMHYDYGMVSAPHRPAVEAGLAILREGGNVVDAAVGAALVQTAVDPLACGIAGMGSMHVYLKDAGVHEVVDFHARAPGAVRPDMWESLIIRECDDGFGFVLKDAVNELGYRSAGTPLTLRGLEKALALYGTRSLADLLPRAIRYCNDGFLVTPYIHAFWTRPALCGRIARIRGLTEHPETARIYTKGKGIPYGVGDIVRNPDMGRTLGRIAEHGADDFYTGAIAAEIHADMRANDGLITLDDLAGCEAEIGAPLWTEYRGYRIASNPLPGCGLMILEMLNILGHFDLAAMRHNSPEYIATVSEAMKIATVDKDAKMGDPRFVDVPVAELLSESYGKARAAEITAGKKAHVPRFNGGGSESRETTHICVADVHGNCVSLSHTLGSSSGVVTPGLGFMYSNAMSVFDPRPGHVGSLEPGKARVSSISPTIIFRDDAPRFLLGSPGGTTITMGNLQAILNLIDFGMTAQEAVSAPRFITTSDSIEISNRIFETTEQKLSQMGYPVIRHALSYMPPKVHVIGMGEGGMLDGGADPSGGGVAAGS